MVRDPQMTDGARLSPLLLRLAADQASDAQRWARGMARALERSGADDVELISLLNGIVGRYCDLVDRLHHLARLAERA